MFTAIAILVATIVGAVAAYLLMPTPQTENAKAAGLDEFNVTTNSNGRVVPIVFGTCKITGNVLWYGDLRSSPLMAG